MLIFRRFPLMDKAGEEGAGGGDANGEAPAANAGTDTAGAKPGDQAASGAAGQGSPDNTNGSSISQKELELLRESMSRKEKIKELESKLAEVQKVWDGLNPDDVRKLIQDRKAAELADMEKKGEFEKIRQQMLEAHNAEKTTLASQITELQQKIASSNSQIDNLTVGQAFATSKFISDELVLTPTKARTVYGAHFDRDESGNIAGYDKPAGSPGRAPLVDGSGSPLSFDAALKKIIEGDPDRDALLKAKIKQGADSGTTGAKPKPDDNRGLTPGVSRIAEALRNGGLKTFKRV